MPLLTKRKNGGHRSTAEISKCPEYSKDDNFHEDTRCQVQEAMATECTLELSDDTVAPFTASFPKDVHFMGKILHCYN